MVCMCPIEWSIVCAWPRKLSTNRKFKVSNKRKWSKSNGNNNETSTALQVLLHHCNNTERNTKMECETNWQKTIRCIYHLLRGMILMWYLFMVGSVPFLPICSRSHLNFFALMSNMKVEFFSEFIYYVHFFRLVFEFKYRPLHQLWFCVRGYCYMAWLG